MADTTGSGTIYRIAPKGFRPKVPPIDLTTLSGQIATLKSPAVNVRALGFAALRKQGEKALPALSKLHEDENPFFAARAVWLLPYCGDKGLDKAVTLTKHADPQMRIAAFRTLRRASNDKELSAKIGKLLERARRTLCEDPSPAVRREVALSLRDVPFDKCRDILTKLADGYDGWDRWYLEALGTACDGKESEAYALLVEKANTPPLEWDRRTSGIAWRLHPPASVEALAGRAASEKLPYDERKRMMNALAFVEDRRAAEHMLTLATKGPKDLRGLAAWWGKNRDKNDWKEYALGDKFPPAPRVNKKKPTRPPLQFTPTGKPIFASTGGNTKIDVDVRGVHRLYLFVDSLGAKPVTAKWLGPTLAGPSGDTDVTSLEWSLAFSGAPTSKKKPKNPRLRLSKPTVLAANAKKGTKSSLGVTAKSIVVYDISGTGFTRFRASGVVDPEFAGMARQIRFRVFVDRSPLVGAKPSLETLDKVRANPTHGRALFFSKHLACSRCHLADGFGGEVGPDLTQIASKHAPRALFEDILEPSAAISTGFETLTVVTKGGQVINGLVVSAGNPVVIAEASGKIHTISKKDIDEMLPSKTSIMPDLKGQLTRTEAAALVAYLQMMAKE